MIMLVAQSISPGDGNVDDLHHNLFRLEALQKGYIPLK